MRNRSPQASIAVVLSSAVALASGLLVLDVFIATPSALAACHSFTVTATPTSVTEGSKVTIKVNRDGAVNPSSVDVSTVDETARSGEDYQAVKRTVSFGTDTEQSFSLSTTDDAAHESTETFRVHLSRPSGCTINPNFALGPDAKVTIKDNDAETTTQPPTTPVPSTTSLRTTTTTAAAVSTTAADTGSSTTAGAADATTTSTTATTSTVAGSSSKKKNDNNAAIAIIGVLALVAVAGGIGAWFVRRRRSG